MGQRGCVYVCLYLCVREAWSWIEDRGSVVRELQYPMDSHTLRVLDH